MATLQRYEDFHKKHEAKKVPFTKDNYEKFFFDEYNIRLGKDLTFDMSERIYEAFQKLPPLITKSNFIARIEINKDLGEPHVFYPNHGRWDNKLHCMYLNPLTVMSTDYMHLITHEAGHAVDHLLGPGEKNISMEPAWLALSGWTMLPPELNTDRVDDETYYTQGEYKRLSLRDDDKLMLARWWHKKNAKFARWYGTRDPREDFAECFSYLCIGQDKRVPPNKAKFIRELMKKKESK